MTLLMVRSGASCASAHSGCSLALATPAWSYGTAGYEAAILAARS